MSAAEELDPADEFIQDAYYGIGHLPEAFHWYQELPSEWKHEVIARMAGRDEGDDFEKFDHASCRWLADFKRGQRRSEYQSVDLDELLAEPDAEYNWLIPGLLERGDRLIVTGAEGTGKSTLLRQIAVKAASGLHPFRDDKLDRHWVTLVVDAENSRRQTKRALRPLRAAAGDNYYTAGRRLQYEFRNDLDLTNDDDAKWLYERVMWSAADLLIIGPLYKLASGDPTKEEIARPVVGVIDDLRTEFGITVIIEAHTPHADTAKGARPERPYGASLWLRWPEFGVFLAPDGTLRHWRGPRDEREWPAKLERGKPWPWMVAAETSVAAPWSGPENCMAAVADLLAELGVELTATNIRDQLKARGHGFRNSTVSEAAERLVVRGTLSVREGPRRGRFYRYDRAVSDDH